MSRGRTQRLASYNDNCDSGAACGARLFETGGDAFVFHAGTLFRVDGSELKPILSTSANDVLGASWPLVALAKRTGDDVTVDVYRLTDGTIVQTIFGSRTEAAVLSDSLLATRDLTAGDLRPLSYIYDIASGRQVALIRDERVVAILDRRILTLAPRGFLIHEIGGPSPAAASCRPICKTESSSGSNRSDRPARSTAASGCAWSTLDIERLRVAVR